jgi:hypothetical protein
LVDEAEVSAILAFDPGNTAPLVDDFQMESRSRPSLHSELIAQAERQL